MAKAKAPSGQKRRPRRTDRRGKRPAAARFHLPALLRPQGTLGGIPPDAWYVSNLAVDPAARGRGIGSALLQDAELIARGRRAASVCLDVEAASLSAIRLYGRSGYAVERTSPIVTVSGRRFQTLRMSKRLDG
jgi:ribosomal protein S18 acetylase RimI-like enzyme